MNISFAKQVLLQGIRPQLSSRAERLRYACLSANLTARPPRLFVRAFMNQSWENSFERHSNLSPHALCHTPNRFAVTLLQSMKFHLAG